MRRTLFFMAIVFALWAHLPAQKASGMGTETFGNEPLVEANYSEWKGIMPLINDKARTYSNWVNGNEHFYYKGNLQDVNAALVHFAAMNVTSHNVILRPAPGVTHNFDGTKDIPFDWQLHITGGIAKHLTRLDKGDIVWPKEPVLTIYIGGTIELEKLEIPKGVTVVDTVTLSQRVIAAMEQSTDISVRGWGCGELAKLDGYRDENINAVAKMLADKDDWVRSNAARVLSLFGKKAAAHLPALRECLTSTDKNLQEYARKSIEQIEAAADTSEEEKKYVIARKKIETFVAARNGGAGK